MPKWTLHAQTKRARSLNAFAIGEFAQVPGGGNGHVLAKVRSSSRVSELLFSDVVYTRAETLAKRRDPRRSTTAVEKSRKFQREDYQRYRAERFKRRVFFSIMFSALFYCRCFIFELSCYYSYKYLLA